MAILFDPNESRDRRMKMLLDTATTAMQIQNQRQQLTQNAQEIALKNPATNPYLRAEQATQNRLRMAQASQAEQYGNYYGKRSVGDVLPASRQNAKDKRTEELLSTINQNAVTRELISDADEAIGRLSSGIYGKLGRGFEKNLAANSPGLADYQKVKLVLTNAQLRESLMLKGAISDTENKWLAEASANDDLLSQPRAKVIFNKMIKNIDAEDLSKMQSYKRSYGDDPSNWEEIKSLKMSSTVKKFAKDTGVPAEVLQQIQGSGKIKAIRLKESK